MSDTIFALSSGAPPAAVAVIRVSGPGASHALRSLAGNLPRARRASLRRLRDANGDTLDQALVLWLPGPATATGEDMVELHLHGGRAVIASVEAALDNMPHLRRAAPGEFTRRAFTNGRIDLAQAEGLADLLSAETELQRRNAIAMAGGALSREVEGWRDRLLCLSAAVEAVLDFADEDDVDLLPAGFGDQLKNLQADIAGWLDRPRTEALKEGFQVVLAGPPNAGKSTLFNALVEREAAITAPLAGTTRDVLTRPVALQGIPFMFADTAGLRDAGGDAIEAIGVQRARVAMEDADLVLWLGPEGAGPANGWEIEAQCDRADHPLKAKPRHRLSAVSGDGVAHLKADLVELARTVMPKPGEVALSKHQHDLLARAEGALSSLTSQGDALLVAEHLRLARVAFDSLLGRTTTEDMLDALFGRFCIGK